MIENVVYNSLKINVPLPYDGPDYNPSLSAQVEWTIKMRVLIVSFFIVYIRKTDSDAITATRHNFMCEIEF